MTGRIKRAQHSNSTETKSGVDWIGWLGVEWLELVRFCARSRRLGQPRLASEWPWSGKLAPEPRTSAGSGGAREGLAAGLMEPQGLGCDGGTPLPLIYRTELY